MCQIMAELTVLGKLLLIFFAVFKNQSIFYFIVQLFGIKRLNWLISSSLKKITFTQVLSRSMKRYPL